MDFTYGSVITSEEYRAFRNMDLSQHFRAKGNLSYLPWGVAMDVLKARNTNLDVCFEKNPETSDVVFGNKESGYYIQAYMVNYETKTRTTPLYHALRDFRNKAITGNYTITDLTNSIQRAIAKVIAMQTGIAMSLYSQIDESIDDVINERTFSNLFRLR